MMEANKNSPAYRRARKQAREIRSFYINLMCYCTVIPILIAINLYYTPELYWFLFSALGWGTGLCFHAMAAFQFNPFLSKKWEARKLQQFIEQEKAREQRYNQNQ